MATPFNLTAEINLRGPTNLKLIVGKIRRELGSIRTDLDLKVKPESAKNIALITSKLKAMSKASVDANANINKLNSSLSSLAASFSSLSSSTSASVNGVNNVSSSVGSAKKTIAATTTEIEEFGKQSGLAIRRFAAFSTVTGIVYSLVNAFSSAFSEFLVFNKEIVRLSQVTGKSTSELKGVADEITRLSTTLGVASSDLLTVSTTLAQAGLSANDTRIALEALAKSALAPSFDNLNETTEGSIAVLRQFGLQANELESALSSINSVAAAFAVESSDLITAIQRTGGVFASSSRGVSEGTDALNEFLAVFTSVRQTTRESAETIATGLRTIFTRIQRGQTIEFLKEYNVELTDLEGKFVGPFEAVKRLSEGLRELDPRDLRFSQIVEELGGFRQIGKVIPLIQQFAVAQEALKVAQKGQGSLAKDARSAQESLAIQFSKTREEFVSLVREIGDSTSFRSLTTIALGLSSGLISLTKALEPLLPLLITFTTLKIGSGLTQYLSGFGKGFGGRGDGGASVPPPVSGPSPGTPPGAVSTAGATNQTNAIVANTTALSAIVQPLTVLSQNLATLTQSIAQTNNLLSARASSGRRFASGGFVPGSGNTDTVPAMLTPGEFVLRKSAVRAIGISRLSNINKYATGGRVSSSRKKRAYVFDFDDTLAESDAVIREGASDPFVDFRGAKAGEFIRSARATRYASMAKKRAEEGYDIHVLTARPGERQTVSAIQQFMTKNVGSPARSVIGTAGFSGSVGGTASAKSMMLKKLSSIYEQIVFLDDDRENVLAAQGISGVRARIARKNAGGLVQKFALGGMVKDITEGWDRKLGAAILEYKDQSLQLGSGTINLKDLYSQVSAKDLLLKNNQPLFNTKNLAFTEIYQGLSENANRIFQEVLDTQIVESINNATTAISSRLRLPPASIDSASSSKFLAGINKGTRGNLFEDILWNINNQSAALQRDKENPDAPFDFPSFNPNLFGNIGYDTLPNKWVDAKASFDRAVRDGGLTNKALNQIKKDIQIGISTGDIIPVFSASQSKLGTANSTVRTSDIKSGNIQKLLREGYITKSTGSTGGGVYTVIKDIPQELLQRTRGFNKGGSVNISPQDTVPALLTPGEFVINKQSAQRIGYSNLKRMNSMKSAKGYNRGGIVGGVQTFQDGGSVLAITAVFSTLLQPQIEKLAESFGKLNKETVSASTALSGVVREASSAIASASIGLSAVGGVDPRVRNQIVATTAIGGAIGGGISAVASRSLEIAINNNSKELSKFDKILQERDTAVDAEARDRASEALQVQFQRLTETFSQNEPVIKLNEKLLSIGTALTNTNSTIIALTTSTAALISAINTETAARAASTAASTGQAVAQTSGILSSISQKAGPLISGFAGIATGLTRFVGGIGIAITAVQVLSAAYSFFARSTSQTAEESIKLARALNEATKSSQDFSLTSKGFSEVLLPAYNELRRRNLSEEEFARALGSTLSLEPPQNGIDEATVTRWGQLFINELNPQFRRQIQANLKTYGIELNNTRTIGSLIEEFRALGTSGQERLRLTQKAISDAFNQVRRTTFIAAGGSTGDASAAQAEAEFERLSRGSLQDQQLISRVTERYLSVQARAIYEAGNAAKASVQLRAAFIDLEDILGNVSAKLTATTTDFESSIQSLDDRINLLSAEPSVSPDRAFRRRAEILSNIQGFSEKRIQNALQETLELITPDSFTGTAIDEELQANFSATKKELREQVTALQRVKRDLPSLLRQIATSGDRTQPLEEIRNRFGKLFDTLNIDESTKNNFVNSIEKILKESSSAGNAVLTLEELLSEVGGLDKFFALGAESQKFLVQVNESYSKVVESLSEKGTQLASTLTNINKLTTQQIKLQAETDLDIRKILGEQIKSADLNQLFDEEIRAITGGIIDPNAIGQELTRLIAQAEATRVDPNINEAQRTQALAQSTSKITRLNTALDTIINSGMKLKRAFEDLEKKEKRLFQGPQSLLDQLIADPSQTRVLEQQVRAFERLASGETLSGTELQLAQQFANLVEQEFSNVDLANEIRNEIRKQFISSAIGKSVGDQISQGLIQNTPGNIAIAFQTLFEKLGQNLVATPDQKRTQLSPELEAIRVEEAALLEAIRISRNSSEQVRDILQRGILETYTRFSENLKDTLANEIKLRQEYNNQLEASVNQQTGVARTSSTDMVTQARKALENIASRASAINATRTDISGPDTIGLIGDVPSVAATPRLAFPDPSTITDLSSAITNLKSAIQEAQQTNRGFLGILFGTENPLQKEIEALKATLESLRAAEKTRQQQLDQQIREQNRRVPIQPGTIRRPQDIRQPSPLDTSSLDKSLNNFATSFERSLNRQLSPLANIVEGLNVAFSSLDSPLRRLEDSTTTLLAGLQEFNDRGGIKGPNIPQEVTVSVSFDDTVTVVADRRNGNNDLLAEIGVLVTETVREQINNLRLFG